MWKKYNNSKEEVFKVFFMRKLLLYTHEHNSKNKFIKNYFYMCSINQTDKIISKTFTVKVQRCI